MKITSIFSVLALVALLVFAGVAHADTAATMIVLYDASGQPVNTVSGTLSAGTYYQLPGLVGPVTYYGDGTFRYNLSGTFGGSVFNPTGRAGIYFIPDSSIPPSVGIPNTGEGGNAAYLWTLIALGALVGVGGLTYLSRRAYVDGR